MRSLSPHNTVLLSFLTSSMNLQFVTGIYGMISYLTRYLTKVENRMSELMKKISKEAGNQDICAKLRNICDVFLTKREASRTRLLKPLAILNTLDPDDPNVFCTNFLDRYVNQPDKLENTCYADFATN